MTHHSRQLFIHKFKAINFITIIAQLKASCNVIKKRWEKEIDPQGKTERQKADQTEGTAPLTGLL